MKIENMYYSKGSMVVKDTGEHISWDKVVLEWSEPVEQGSYYTSIFGGRYHELKIKREELELVLGKVQPVQLKGHNIDLVYDYKGKLKEIKLLD